MSRERASTCGRGFPEASWLWDGKECQHLGGHDDDYLFFRSPLRGEFSVEADLRGFNTTQVLTAGAVFGPHAAINMITGTFRSGAIVKPVDPPFHRTDKWIRYRSVVRNGVHETWLHGRLVDTRKLPPDFDPWLAIRSWSRTPGAVRDVRISGNPEIPSAVVLSNPGCLSGWWGYHDERVEGENAQWLTPENSPDGAQIIGVRRGLPGWAIESLLRYHRPLIEDGSIDYDFYYTPGQVLTHPALGRLAFVLADDGVRLHWITDARFDRSSLAPENSFLVSGQKDRPDPLPLKSDAWNAMRLSLAGRTVKLELNGEKILEQELGASNSRHFGLFHYSGRTEVRVRNVIMRGDWPTTLPSVREQQLADPPPEFIDESMAKMSPVFSHEFAKDGLPAEYFKIAGGFDMSTTAVTPAGLVHSQKSDGRYRHSRFDSWLRMAGDFDITADFAELEIEPKQICGCELYVTFDGGYAVGVKRRWQKPNLQRLVVDWALPAEPGTSTAKAGQFRRVSDFVSTEVLGGRFRVARRGDTVYALFAEHDSTEFRVVSSKSFKTIGQLEAQVRLQVLANESGSTRVTWKRLRMGADKLLVAPNPAKPPKLLLYVMNADGSDLRAITEPFEDPAIHGPASPDWSPNGDLIAFDGFTGRAETSHSYLIRPDGTGLKDLGIGIMPTFSPDGNRLAFTWARNGMTTMNLDGEDRQVVTPDGWAAQWSPNGKWISYETRSRVNGSYSANLTTIDLKSKKKRLLLEGEHAEKYSQIFWNAAWSPDSRQIAFKGKVKDSQFEVAITSVDGSSKGFRVVTTETTQPDMAWHPNGKSLLLAMTSKAHGGNRLFVFDLETSELSLLESQPMDRFNFHGAWSPDGQRLVFSSRQLPEPVPWKPRKTLTE